MSWDVRLAARADEAELRSFSCRSGDDCSICAPDGGNNHEREVEEYIQRHALDVMERLSAHNDHRLLVLTDDGGAIGGIVAHESSELKVRGREVPGKLLVVAALRTELHGQAVDGKQLSSSLLRAAIEDMAADEPELVRGRVAVCNARSRGLLSRHELSMELSPDRVGYVDLVGSYAKVSASLAVG